MRSLSQFSAALAGLLIIVVGTFIPSGLFVPAISGESQIINLQSSLQVPSVLLSSLICGPIESFIAVIAYIFIGLFQLPIFNDGGGLNYITSPGFGYLMGFIPASLICGVIARRNKLNNLLGLILSAIIGLFFIHIIGFIYLSIGHLVYDWDKSFLDLFYNYALGPLPSQLILCTAVGLLGLIGKRLLGLK